MSKAFELLEIGITEKGDPFCIPRYHTCITGATGTGKTEAARKIVSTLRTQIPDLKVLIFDVKSTGRDWQGYGKDVPIYVETATDSRFLRDLIETQERRKIDWFFYELHIACQTTRTWEDVLQNLTRRYRKYKDKNQMKEEKLGTLIIYMEALISELSKGDITPNFDLSNPITVVPLNYREEAFKQLVVYSYLTAMKKRRVQKVLVVCDEMSSLAPSTSGTGCKRVIEQFLFKQGRAAELFGLAIDQEITGISPSVRRQCWNWILGMQTDTSAQERTAKEIPGHQITIDNIGTLGVGWWWAVVRTPSTTSIEKFYLIPEGVNVDTGKKVLSGETKIETVMRFVEDERRKEVYKVINESLAESAKKYPKLAKIFYGIPENVCPKCGLAPDLCACAEVEKEQQRIKVMEDDSMYKEKAEQLEKELKETKEKMEDLKKSNEKLLEEVKNRGDKARNLDALRDVLRDIVGHDEPNYAYTDQEITKLREEIDKKIVGTPVLSTGKVQLNLEKMDLAVTVKHETKEVNMTTDNLEGKVMFIVVTHFADKSFAEEELQPFIGNYGWQIPHNSLAPLMGSTLQKKGLLVKSEGKYKLPTFVKVNVKGGDRDAK